MPFQIIRNDITKVKADAIVNTANPKPTYGGGTDSAIYEAAGKKSLLAERKKIGDIKRGEAAYTPAFKLDAKYIIHTVGPVWEDGEHGEFEILKNCYVNSLNLALELKCKSIAFPLIATGTYGFPKDKALQIAMSVIQPFLMEHSMKITLVVFSKSAFELSGKVVENVREYVDANYVKEAKKREYRVDSLAYRNMPLDDVDDDVDDDGADMFLETEYARQRRMLDEQMLSEPVMSMVCEPTEKGSQPKGNKGSSSKKVDIQSLIDSSEMTFQEKLFEIIDAKGLKDSQVYKDVVSKQVFSKIRGDKYYHPNKYTAIALCLNLHLDVEQTQDLIGRAGWTLSPSSKADLVVKGCIMNKEYSVVNIDIILFDYDCAPLSKIK